MKKIYTLLLFIAIAAVSNAQVELRYCETIDGGYGNKGSIYFPYVQFSEAVVKPYVGATVNKVYIGLKHPVTNVTLYIKNSPKDTKPLYSQKVGALEEGWNEVTLDTPFVIPEGVDVSFGYKCSVSDKANAIGYSSDKYSPADQIMYNSSWTTCGGSLCIKALVEGDNLPQNEMLIGKLNNLDVASTDEFLTMHSTARNAGNNEVNGYSILCKVDNDDPISYEIDHTVGINALDSFTVDLPLAKYAAGTHNVTLSIGKVNGVDDSYSANNDVSSTFTVPDMRFQRTVVCEEHTGNWCGFCPRGMVGMELMKEAHPGRFIAVCIHCSSGTKDPLEVDTDAEYGFSEFSNSFSGAPNCRVDRKIEGDPYTDISNMYKTETSSECNAALSLGAAWNEDMTSIKADISFFTKKDVAHAYKVAFIITEDSIDGKTHNLYQHNYYNGGDSFFGWESKSDPTTDVIYNDIARGVFSNYKGDVCSPETITAEQTYEYSYTFDVPTTIYDKKNVNVVAELLDSESGYVVNAAIVRPTSGDETGVRSASADKIVTGRTFYNLQGMQTSPTHGVMLRKTEFSDGTSKVEKIMVK